MRVEATFSQGFRAALNNRAIGDEFQFCAKARIIGAEETLLDVTEMGELDPHYLQGELEVRLLLSHPTELTARNA